MADTRLLVRMSGRACTSTRYKRCQLGKVAGRVSGRQVLLLANVLIRVTITETRLFRHFQKLPFRVDPASPSRRQYEPHALEGTGCNAPRDKIHYKGEEASFQHLSDTVQEGSMKTRQFQVVCTLFLMIALAVVITAVSKPLAAQAPLRGVIRTLLNGDECMQPVNGSTVAGAAIVLEPCSGHDEPAQLWTIVPYKGIYVHYVNQLSGMCLDARGGAQNQTPVQQWPCNSISNEYWVYNPVRTGSSPVYINSGVAGSYPNFCLDVPGAQATSGAALQIYKCNFSAAQEWF
jgi:hypothetical protein